MALKYRKKIKIAPGIYMNLSKSGISTTVGVKGASVNFGKKGTYLNTGIPGTGLYDRKKIGGKAGSNANNSKASQDLNSCCAMFLMLGGILFITLIGAAAIEDFFNVDVFGLAIILGIVIWVIVLVIKVRKESKEEAIVATTPGCLTDGAFNLMVSEATALYRFLKTATDDSKITEELDKKMVINNNGTPAPIKDKILLSILLDAYRCYVGLGHKLDSGKNEEIGLYIFGIRAIGRDEDIQFGSLDQLKESVFPSLRNLFNVVIQANEQMPFKDGEFFFNFVFENVNPQLISQYAVLLYRFASSIAKVDGHISPTESQWLSSLLKTTGEKTLQGAAQGRIEPNIKNLDSLTIEAAKLIIENKNTTTTFVQRSLAIGYARTSKIMEQLENLGIVGPSRVGGKQREILCNSVDELYQKLEQKQNCEEVKTDKVVHNQSDLKDLIGLQSVKEEVEKLTNFIKINKIRKEKGLPISNITYHCVFTGNPGTGKTTVARIIAGIYKDLGVIKSGHLVETDRSGLVAEYVGQTAVKTNKIIDSALDGVLFIDEAYSLVTGSNNDYGQEAISTLLKRMEDDRERLVVILAGYGDEMKTFIDSNPGLQSRFNRYIHFPDYDVQELKAIYMANLEKHKYILDEEAELLLSQILETAVANKDKNFGNARFVRNIFEKTLENQAMRLAEIGSLTSKMLSTITVEDIKGIEL